MASLQDVHELIHSLKKHEKIQLKLHINAFAGKSKERYIADYQCFEKTKDFNKEILKTKLNKVKKRKNLSETNTNLYNFILSTLVQSNQKTVRKIGLLNDIQELEIFYEKGLYRQCERNLPKVKKRCEETGESTLKMYISSFEVLLLQHNPKKAKSYDERRTILQNQLDTLDSYKLRLRLKDAKQVFWKLATEIGTPREQSHLDRYETEFDKSIFEEDPSTLEQNAILDYYVIKTLYSQVTFEGRKNFPNMAKVIREGIALVKQKVNEKENPTPLFLLIKLDLEMHVLGRQPIEVIKEKLLPFKALSNIVTSGTHMNLIKFIGHWATLLSCIYNLKTNEGLAYVNEFKAEILDEHNRKKTAHHYMNYFSCARICFLAEDYDQSLEFIDMLIDKEDLIRPSLLPHIYCLNLMNQHKLDNRLLLPYAIRKVYDQLLKEKTLYEPEKALISFLKQALKVTNLKPEMQKLYDKLLPLKDDAFNSSFFGNGDYMHWLETELAI